MVETISRPQLTEAIIREVGLSRNESAEIVEAVLAEVSDALVRGEMVKLSSFGSFSVRQKGQRLGRNPKTGDKVYVPKKELPFFRAGKDLRQKVNDGMGSQD